MAKLLAIATHADGAAIPTRLRILQLRDSDSNSGSVCLSSLCRLKSTWLEEQDCRIQAFRIQGSEETLNTQDSSRLCGQMASRDVRNMVERLILGRYNRTMVSAGD